MEGDEERERFAEEAAGDRDGLGDGGECGAIVPLEEEPVVADEGLALGVVEPDAEPGGLIGERGQQLAGVVVAGCGRGGQGDPRGGSIDMVCRASSRLLRQDH